MIDYDLLRLTMIEQLKETLYDFFQPSGSWSQELGRRRWDDDDDDDDDGDDDDDDDDGWWENRLYFNILTNFGGDL